MKTWITTACIVAGLAIAGQTQAQSLGSTYRTALGVKFWPAGITVKHFVKNNRALEGIDYHRDTTSFVSPGFMNFTAI
ncbi:MAG: hypothetical protein KAF40_08665 [Flavihumibacter sp.]|nr:hypothetical protein [Flavihumibacter sp.]